MKTSKTLVACINNLTSSVIKAKFVLVNRENGTVEDVTSELFDTMQQANTNYFNAFKLKGSMLHYAFGCGLTHYLQNDTIEFLVKENEMFNNCNVEALTPNDLKNILGVKNANDPNLLNAVRDYYRL